MNLSQEHKDFKFVVSNLQIVSKVSAINIRLKFGITIKYRIADLVGVPKVILTYPNLKMEVFELSDLAGVVKKLKEYAG